MGCIRFGSGNDGHRASHQSYARKIQANAAPSAITAGGQAHLLARNILVRQAVADAPELSRRQMMNCRWLADASDQRLRERSQRGVLPQSSVRYGSIASRTSARMGVVA